MRKEQAERERVERGRLFLRRAQRLLVLQHVCVVFDRFRKPAERHVYSATFFIERHQSLRLRFAGQLLD